MSSSTKESYLIALCESIWEYPTESKSLILEKSIERFGRSVRNPSSSFRNLGIVLHFIRSKTNKVVFDKWLKDNNLTTYFKGVVYDPTSEYAHIFNALTKTTDIGKEFCYQLFVKLRNEEPCEKQLQSIRCYVRLLKVIVKWLNLKSDFHGIVKELNLPKHKTVRSNRYLEKNRLNPVACSPLCWAGSKKRQSDKIINLLSIPKNGVFLEPFGGSGIISLMLRIQRPDVKIHLNDLYLPFYAFHKTIKEDVQYLIEKIKTDKPNKEKWLEYKRLANTEVPLNELAWMFYYIRMYSFNQLGVAYSEDHQCKDELKIKKMEIASELMYDFEITNLDFRDVLKKEGMAYVDPPYFMTLEKNFRYYYHLLTQQDHHDLSVLLKQRESWLLSYDDHPSAREFYKDFEILNLEVNRPMGKHTRNFSEILIRGPI